MALLLWIIAVVLVAPASSPLFSTAPLGSRPDHRRSARRPDDDRIVASERPQGSFSRQLFLGYGLDADGVSASYHDGVPTVAVPVSEQAKPCWVEISANGHELAIGAGSTTS